MPAVALCVLSGKDNLQGHTCCKSRFQRQRLQACIARQTQLRHCSPRQENKEFWTWVGLLVPLRVFSRRQGLVWLVKFLGLLLVGGATLVLVAMGMRSAAGDNSSSSSRWSS
jgi:hypothetical protein